jgi:hypothetical protein
MLLIVGALCCLIVAGAAVATLVWLIVRQNRK